MMRKTPNMSLCALIADDSYAMTFQSMWLYRTALLRHHAMHMTAKVEAQPPQWLAVDTVGDMVRNLLTLDQAAPIFTAYHVDVNGQRRCRTGGITISRERVVDKKWIEYGRKDVPYSHVIWARPDEQYHRAATNAPGTPGADVTLEEALFALDLVVNKMSVPGLSGQRGYAEDVLKRATHINSGQGEMR